ncbi:MAG: nucleotide exchange factor GrpE [Spirochaetaceae bacterium]|jgi:hypothetical protein|nr:nucleotide exchange factor GrpE [Spirochaetaceae bacterium]
MEEEELKTAEIGENSVDAAPVVQCADTPESAGDLAIDKAPDADQHKPQDREQAAQMDKELLVQQWLKPIAESSEKTSGEIREMHKLYHNEFSSRLRSMQEELDRYHDIERGRVFDGILGDVAKLYSDYESLVTEITDDKVKKRAIYMFQDIFQILEANGVSKLESKPGDRRNPRHCQVLERIPTDDPALHDTVKLSRNTGFYIENRTLVKELVDICIFTDTNSGNQEKH